ncbi:putative molybdenum carrier protein [Legionella cardiaca]|uniref:Molybdenum carrier protein n=1 Tax=Legionella cardiaca TaxID=1071983 RepID=A0ABY8AUD6_9GAMM|nr:putative molybdenum carrier protein [Legionella cardiaca]WED42762.1 putative molybdenum carrier protein [Legionella cardiaca]
MIEKVVSGGQTGVDQAGLLIANEMGMTVGGWCPKGGMDENSESILKKYPSLKETTTENSDERTKLNIRDSDGTLIIVPRWPLSENIKDGTRLTIEEAERQKKPYLIISLDIKKDASVMIKAWVNEHNISVLNIAGPRESNSPGIHAEACNFFRELFCGLSAKKL